MLCAVAALDKFINDNKIRAMSKRNLSNIWYLVCGTSVDELRKTALIANCTQEPVQFVVMSSHEEFAFYHCDVKYMKRVYLPTYEIVCVGPGQTVTVRGGLCDNDDDIVVFKDYVEGPFFVERNCLHFWTYSLTNPVISFMRNWLPFLTSGPAAKNSRMIMFNSTMEMFKINMKKLGTDL